MLTNEGTGLLPNWSPSGFYDKMLGNPEQDYSRISLDQFLAASAAARAAAQPPVPAAPYGPGSDYYGIYDSPITGPAKVALHSGTLQLTFDATRSAFVLKPWSGDVVGPRRTPIFWPSPKAAIPISCGSCATRAGGW